MINPSLNENGDQYYSVHVGRNERLPRLDGSRAACFAVVAVFQAASGRHRFGNAIG